MAYRVNLNTNQQLTVTNQGNQTLITLVSSSPGQQQSQNNSFTTGNWNSPPLLLKVGESFLLQIDGDRGQHFVSIQANSIRTVTSAPPLHNAEEIDLEDIPDPTGQNNFEFEPIEPMQMGNMSMSMNPMSMRLGNMSIDMGRASTSRTSTSTKRFCTQCGQKAKTSDRFCSSCGHKLDN